MLPSPKSLGITEPACDRTLDHLAPRFRGKVAQLLSRLEARGFHAKVAESNRTEARQQYLFGFGRRFDDGRGNVTGSATAATTWHGYGLAVDIVHSTLEWNAPAAFWTALREEATALSLTSGDDWDRDGIPVEQDPTEHRCDKPHVQWWCEGMHVSPSEHAQALYHAGQIQTVWSELHAA